ncbi:MAG: hypothetical protein AAB473_00630 [Patescibacteria group bacterium]
MAKQTFDIPSVDAVDETAAEFLRAREVKVPESIDELRQASESASEAVEQIFGNFDRLRAMKEESEERVNDDPPPESYNAWIDAALDLDAAFLEDGDGALGRELIELAKLDDVAFADRKDEARRLLLGTANIALRMYPSVHRLVTLGFGVSRPEVIEKLSAGELVQNERVHGVSVTPRRRTIIGLLRHCDARLPEEERTNIWTLEVPPELPQSIVVSDPFNASDDTLAAYWSRRIGAVHETRGKETAIVLLSGEKTTSVLWELENIAEHADDDVLRAAAGRIVRWLEDKQIYYTDPDPRDFELYHLGMEDPQTLIEIMRSLDVIKHFDPEFFFELIGIDPLLGGRSVYFGSFLHKAMYNTQRVVDHASPELGEMALRTMTHQLLTLDESVQTYSAVVSKQSLKAMAGQMRSTIDAAQTEESKAQAFIMMAVPFSRIAIHAEVRRQLEAMREASPENIAEELRRRIDDIEHPLKLADYLVNLPKHATDDLAVRRQLREIFSEKKIENGTFRNVTSWVSGEGVPEKYELSFPTILPELYNRIPLIDETRDDLGFALRVKVAIRDAVALASNIEEFTTKSSSEKTRARQFLKFIMPDDLFREDFEAIWDQLFHWASEQTIASRFHYANRSALGQGYWLVDDGRSEEDRAFFIGQQLIVSLSIGSDTNVEPYFERMKEIRADLVFLSIIAHPKGKEIAFKYFDKFCEMIPAERMVELLKQRGKMMQEFLRQFEKIPSDASRTYLLYLRKALDSRPGDYGSRDPLTGISWRWKTDADASRIIEPLRKINKAILAGGTPWEIQYSTEVRRVPIKDIGKFPKYIDLFDLHVSLKSAFLAAGFDRLSTKNPDVDPPTEEEMREMRSFYDKSGGTYHEGVIDFEKLIISLRRYFLGDYAYSTGVENVLRSTVQNKILGY